MNLVPIIPGSDHDSEKGGSVNTTYDKRKKASQRSTNDSVFVLYASFKLTSKNKNKKSWVIGRNPPPLTFFFFKSIDIFVCN